jgi:hypothetical protein
MGEGPYQLTLRVRELAHARAWLDRSGVAFLPAPDTPGGLLVPPESALGAQFELVETD